MGIDLMAALRTSIDGRELDTRRRWLRDAMFDVYGSTWPARRMDVASASAIVGIASSDLDHQDRRRLLGEALVRQSERENRPVRALWLRDDLSPVGRMMLDAIEDAQVGGSMLPACAEKLSAAVHRQFREGQGPPFDPTDRAALDEFVRRARRPGLTEVESAEERTLLSQCVLLAEAQGLVG